MAQTSISTPDDHINSAFKLLPGFLSALKLTYDNPSAWAPGVPGYGVDAHTPLCQDTRDNRWMTWAARYCEPDDDHLAMAAPAILERAFTPDGTEAHQAAGVKDDYLHHYVWWLLEVALGYMYTGDTSLNTSRIRRIVERMLELNDTEGIGVPHTDAYRFVTSIGEPVNTDPGQAYGFFNLCNLEYSCRVFADLARARGDDTCEEFFARQQEITLAYLRQFRDPNGLYYALRERETGQFRHRVIEPEGVCQMTDNVFFPLAFGVLDETELRAALDYVMPTLRRCFPVAYCVPPYGGDESMAWWMPRSWQECLAHYCLGLRKIEKCEPIPDALHRLAARFAQDNEVWEHYDPETGNPHGYKIPPRPGYAITSACFNICAVEALFGIRPEQPGFEAVSIRPSFPESWGFAEMDTTVNGRRFCFRMRRDEDLVTYDFTGSDDVPASLLLPLPTGWNGGNAKANIEGAVRLLRNEGRTCFEARHGLGSLVVRLQLG